MERIVVEKNDVRKLGFGYKELEAGEIMDLPSVGSNIFNLHRKTIFIPTKLTTEIYFKYNFYVKI